MLADEANSPPSYLLALPPHLLHLVLTHVAPDDASLVAAGQTCRALLDAVSDTLLWPQEVPLRGAVCEQLAVALGAAARLPPPLLAARLSFAPLSRFQAAVSLRGLLRSLVLLKLGDTPATTRSLAEQLSRATRAVVCVRPEPGSALVRLHLRPAFVCASVLNAAVDRPLVAAWPSADVVAYQLSAPGVWGSGQMAARQAVALLRAPASLRAAMSSSAGPPPAGCASEADSRLAMLLQDQLLALQGGSGRLPRATAADALRSALALALEAAEAAERVTGTPLSAALRGACRGAASAATVALCHASASALERTLALCCSV
jgi:hypothetical protein